MFAGHRTKVLSGVCTAVTAVLLLSVASLPAAAATAEQAKAWVERAVAHIEAVGKTQAFADFSRPNGDFVKGHLYIFCYAEDGVNLAHGGNPNFVGKNLLHVKDPDGVEVNAEIIKLAMAEGTGWLEFKWPNPVSRKVEQKTAYVVKIDNDTVCGSGYYES